jgi:hypothetical protein
MAASASIAAFIVASALPTSSGGKINTINEPLKLRL